MYKKIIEKELVFGEDRYIKATRRREIRDFNRKHDRCGSNRVKEEKGRTDKGKKYRKYQKKKKQRKKESCRMVGFRMRKGH